MVFCSLLQLVGPWSRAWGPVCDTPLGVYHTPHSVTSQVSQLPGHMASESGLTVADWLQSAFFLWLHLTYQPSVSSNKYVRIVSPSAEYAASKI